MDKKGRISHLRKRIRDTHVLKDGQAYGWEACGVSGTDVCEICGLQHHWGRNGQNSGDYDTYETADGTRLTLAQAARIPCEL